MSEKNLKVLALDTSTRVSSVALIEGDRVAGESLLYSQKNHSEKLLNSIDELFKNTQITPESIDLIAVSVGPGSFTGLRVGISTAQGLAFAIRKDVISVSVLEVLAFQSCMYRGFICPMIDARKQQVYTCLYFCSEEGTLEKVMGETVVEPENWLTELSNPALFVGDGAWAFREKIKKKLKENAVLPSFLGTPRASTLAYIASKSYIRNRRNELEKIIPLYVRPPDVETNSQIRKGSFNPIA